MPVSQNTYRIPRSEWEDRKSRLIELYLDLKLPLCGPSGVIETMANEGFTATKPQYEYQFRAWKVRKNMKRHEYERIIQERQQGREPAPIMLEGRIVSNARSERALRRYAGGLNQAEGSVPRENRNTAWGIAAAPTSLEHEHTPADDLASKASTPTTGSDNRFSGRGINVGFSHANPNEGGPFTGQDNEPINMASFENYGTSASNIDIDDLINTVDFSLPETIADGLIPDWMPGPVMDIMRIQHHQLPPLRLSDVLPDTTTGSIRYSPNSMAVTYEGSPNVIHWQARILQRRQWIPPSTAITAILIKEICGAAPATSTRDFMSISCDLTSDLLSSKGSVGTGRHPTNIHLVLRNLLSKETLFGEDVIKPPSDATDNVATEARLYSRLIQSIINGFAGLEGVPAAGVLRFLNKNHTMSLSMVMLLSSSWNPATQSLTENIFKAALEQDNVSIVNFLLNHSGSVHANDTVCYYRGVKYTPFEMALINQSYGVVELLLERHVDVNKSFSGSGHSNPLGLLLMNADQKLTFSDQLLSLVDQLLLARAEVSLDQIKNQLHKFADQRLTIRLIDEYASQAPEELVSDQELLINIVQNLTKPNAERVIDLIIKRCQGVGADWCSYQSLLCRAVKNIDYELVEFLVSSVPPSDVLQITESTKDKKMIDLVRVKCPAIYENEKKTNGIQELIAALGSGNQDSLRAILEEKDILKRLTCQELGRAFIAALDKGNLQFATQVSNFDPDFRFADNLGFNMDAAIRAALAHDYDDIAWELTALVATTPRRQPLHVAVEQRKPDFVRAFIESGFRLTPDETKLCDGQIKEEHRILMAAIEWGDKSIIRDLWQARRGAIYPCPELMNLAIKNGQMDLFWDIFKAWGIQNPNDRWPGAINVAIKCGDLCLLDELVSRGARLDDDKALETALISNFSMARPLLERYRKGYPKGCTGYGRRSIELALHRYPERLEWMDLLLEFDLVSGDNIREDKRGITLLALAIHSFKRYQFFREGCPGISVIEKLLDAGSDTNVIMFDISMNRSLYFNTTAFLLAIETTRADIVKLLIERGAEVNKPARFGIRRTPLQKAAELNNIEIVGLLLEHGAEVNAPPAIFGGATALQFAAIHGNCELAMTLIEHGAQLDLSPSKGPHGRWPLEGAAENGRLDMIQLLWDANSGPFDDKQCQKAMRLAEHYGHLGCRDLIKELMANSLRSSW
ncbi:hypothetical protein F4680DRAFT_470180 [Xylaria scruposa]|nr:hypothetical protein F4680DRAFT_470180 [Xylaria scruposa]